MLISTAYAQSFGGGAGGQAGGIEAFAPLILIFVVFYFLLIRPQQQRAKKHKAMLEALRRGDKVVTGGGIIGSVVKILNDTEVEVEIASNVKIRVMRGSIQDVLNKPEAVAAKPDDASGSSSAS